MLTMHPRFDSVLVRFQSVVPRLPPRAVCLMYRDESAWIAPESGCHSSQMPTNGHDYTYGALGICERTIFAAIIKILYALYF